MTTADAASITAVSLVRPGSVTHGFDEDQRFLSLAFTTGSGTLSIQAPANANLAPPGYYMLFLVNSAGIPSVAPFVQFAAPGGDTVPPTPPSGLTGDGAIGSATLSWTAATDNTGVALYNVHRSTIAGFQPTTSNRIGQPTFTGLTDTGVAGRNLLLRRHRAGRRRQRQRRIERSRGDGARRYDAAQRHAHRPRQRRHRVRLDLRDRHGSRRRERGRGSVPPRRPGARCRTHDVTVHRDVEHHVRDRTPRTR